MKMIMKRFRIAKNDTVKSYISSGNKLLASDYNSSYTRISEVIGVLNRKIPYFGGKKLYYTITISEKEISKTTIKKVN